MFSRILNLLGYKLIKNNAFTYLPDAEKDFFEMLMHCKPFTMTSYERLYSIYTTVNYLIKNNIDGDFVECGVWKGGSAMMMCLALLKLNVTDKKIYLYDTYQGMTEPTEVDTSIRNKSSKKKYEDNINPKGGNNWCRAELQEVKQNLSSTNYPQENIIFVKGKVEETIPKTMPDKISFLRLDTDWYESTLHELTHLYSKITTKGVLIIDDYGHWKGCRKAVDQYFKSNNIAPLLNRIDYSSRLVIVN